MVLYIYRGCPLLRGNNYGKWTIVQGCTTDVPGGYVLLNDYERGLNKPVHNHVMYLSPRWVVQTSSTFLLLALMEELVKDSKRFRFDSKLFEIPTNTDNKACIGR